MNDLYANLGIKETASLEEIKKAYRKLSKKFHPDVNEGDKYFEERFKEIQNAYEILSDPIKRLKYDSARRSFEGQSRNYDFFSREEQLKKEREEIKKKEEQLRRKEEELKQKADRFKEYESKDDKRKPFASWIALMIVFVVGLVLAGNFFRSRPTGTDKPFNAIDTSKKWTPPEDAIEVKSKPKNEADKKPWEQYKTLNDSGLRLIDDRGFSTLKEGHWKRYGSSIQY